MMVCGGGMADWLLAVVCVVMSESSVCVCGVCVIR